MRYDNPFPGMNPYLEHRHIWPGFHNRLIAALADSLGTRLPDNYRIELQVRVEVQEPFDQALGLAAIIPDALVTGEPAAIPVSPAAVATTAVATRQKEDEVEEEAGALRVRMPREVRVSWLRVETVPERELVTVVEVLSPTNKRPGEGRRRYIRKREAVVAGLVNLVEIDLLRSWEPMPLESPPPITDYRILVCRSMESPGALLYPFTVRQRIPKFTLPLLSEDEASAPEVDLGAIVDRLHHTARYGQVARYDQPPPEPAFPPETQAWVAERVAGLVATE